MSEKEVGTYSTATKTGGKPRLPSDDRRAEIVAAATRLCGPRGFHGVRTREIAAEAGVSEALLFRHFPTKKHMIRAVLDLDRVTADLEALEAVAPGLPPREALLALAGTLMRHITEQPDRMRLMFYGLMETPEIASGTFRELVRRVIAVETAIFERAAAGESPGGRLPAWHGSDPALVARAFHGSMVIHNLLVNVFRLDPPLTDPMAKARELVNLVLPEVHK